jgi:hypothetical protein
MRCCGDCLPVGVGPALPPGYGFVCAPADAIPRCSRTFASEPQWSRTAWRTEGSEGIDETSSRCLGCPADRARSGHDHEAERALAKYTQASGAVVRLGCASPASDSIGSCRVPLWSAWWSTRVTRPVIAPGARSCIASRPELAGGQRDLKGHPCLHVQAQVALLGLWPQMLEGHRPRWPWKRHQSLFHSQSLSGASTTSATSRGTSELP